MNYFENFRQQNPHLFGEDSDYSDTEPDFDPEENEEIEIEESQETDDYEALKSTLNFTPVNNEVPQRGRPASRTSNSRTQIHEIPENIYEKPLDLFKAMYGNNLKKLEKNFERKIQKNFEKNFLKKKFFRLEIR